MKTTTNLNRDWLYYPGAYQASVRAEDMRRVCLPHANQEVPLTYFDETGYQFASFYTRTVSADREQAASRSFLHFEGVMACAEVFLNGEYLGGHKGGYTPFTLETTGKLRAGDNLLLVCVDSAERPDVPPFGYSIDYLTFGGIYRDVELYTADRTYIADLFAKPSGCAGGTASLEAEVTLDALLPEAGVLTVALRGDAQSHRVAVPVNAAAGQTAVTVRLDGLTDVRPWELDDPALYTLTAEYASDASQDTRETRIGFRQAVFTPEGFFLNGRPLKLRGLNRHQSYPYVGYAMPARVQRRDADILKDELGLNLVRTSHYPQSRDFLDRCDEIGLLVFEEIPGWQHVGDEAWQDTAVENVREMIRRDRHHPSIILWGVRINESQDFHDFYLRTNALAHELDPTRQTGGVRCIENSELLEDVYTMNDFIFTGSNEMKRDQRRVTGLERDVPYLITEFCGHMCPTKAYDHEERVIEQAWRHMGMHDAVGRDPSTAGAIGWCAFDYQTHNNFGSGDRICYHGVMDIFRLPKMAAHFYRSQLSPQKEPVLEAATYWSVGDRNGGGITPLTVFTNCDYIEVEVNGKELGRFYPDKERFPGLEYPPCVIDNFNVCWGEAWGGGVFRGYVDGRLAIRREYAHDPVPSCLEVRADDAAIAADGSDATRVTVRALDQKGNVLPFFFSPLAIRVEGPGLCVGDTLVSTQAGVYAFWVRSSGASGDIRVTVDNPRLGAQSLTIAAKG